MQKQHSASGIDRDLRTANDGSVQHSARLQAVLDTIHSGVALFNSSGDQVYVNEAQSRIFESERPGATVLTWEKISKSFRVQTYPDHRDLASDEWPVSRVLAGETLAGNLYCVKQLETDAERILIISGSPVYDEDDRLELAVMGLNDITELIQTDAALAEARDGAEQQRAQLQAILDNVYDGISVFDHEGKHIYRNDESARIYGFNTAFS